MEILNTSIVIYRQHAEKLTQIEQQTGLNRSEIMRQLISSAQVVPAQLTAIVEPGKRSRKRERVAA